VCIRKKKLTFVKTSKLYNVVIFRIDTPYISIVVATPKFMTDVLAKKKDLQNIKNSRD